MKSGLLLIAAALAVLAVAPSRAEDESAPLRICLNEELPPFSVRNKQGGAGFDVLAAQALAKLNVNSAPHSIISSAIASSVGGNVSPIALAVLLISS